MSLSEINKEVKRVDLVFLVDLVFNVGFPCMFQVMCHDGCEDYECDVKQADPSEAFTLDLVCFLEGGAVYAFIPLFSISILWSSLMKSELRRS